MSNSLTPLAVDSGGTFTDFVYLDDDGRLRADKVPSTPENPERAVLNGLESASASIGNLVHGMTVATNAVLEREGAKTAFVTTEGFQDLLAIGRQHRLELYDLSARKHRPLVDRDDTFGVEQRVGPDGNVESPLNSEDVEQLIDDLENADSFGAIAVCLLHAYVNPEHEKRVVSRLRSAFPETYITASHEILREIREYERASTTALNAYVGPALDTYLDRLDKEAKAQSIEIFHSGGGRMSIDKARANAASTLLSGPAGGVVGARSVGKELGCDKIISFDMGGTSTDVSLCDGDIRYRDDAEVDGLPVGLRLVDIHTVGAGGGSIARVDDGGLLKVGPASAGAEPGPACYGRGGQQPTVTDAHVQLGRLPTVGEHLNLQTGRAKEVVRQLANKLGAHTDETALSILEVADASMVRALKRVSVQNGHDPRDFSLVAFGGAGGLHACRLAEELDISTVIVPHLHGVLSAYGMLKAPRRRRFAQSVVTPLSDLIGSDGPSPELRSYSRQLLDRARDSDWELKNTEFSAELRYTGQGYELSVPVDWHPDKTEFKNPVEAFHERHEQQYGYRDETASVELVTLELMATYEKQGFSSPQSSPEVEAQSIGPDSSLVRFRAGVTEVPVRSRAHIADSAGRRGPLIVPDFSGTTVIPSGWHVQIRGGHLVIEETDEGR